MSLIPEHPSPYPYFISNAYAQPGVRVEPGLFATEAMNGCTTSKRFLSTSDLASLGASPSTSMRSSNQTVSDRIPRPFVAVMVSTCRSHSLDRSG